MASESRRALRCPYCGYPFELVVRDDVLHPNFSLEKPRENDVEGDIREEIYDCRNPACRRPVTVYYFMAKRFFHKV